MNVVEQFLLTAMMLVVMYFVLPALGVDCFSQAIEMFTNGVEVMHAGR